MRLIDAKIRTIAHFSPDGKVESVEAWWQGGTTAAIADAVLTNGDPRFIQRDGDSLDMAGLKLVIVEHDEVSGIYYVQKAV